MSTSAKWLRLFLSLLVGILFIGGHASYAAQDITLYTPFTKISVSPGESIDYTIEIINGSAGVRNVEISLTGIPKGWNYDLKSGGWNIGQISVLPGEKKNFTLRVMVPLQVDKGTYRFRVVANGFDSLPLTVTVSKQGTFKTEFTTKQANMQGHSNSTFTFTAELKNRTGDKQLYALIANTLPGWSATFKVSYKPATSVSIEANSNENITLDLDPPDQIEAGTYKVPVSAVTNTTSATLELEVVITGTYTMDLTTPQGLLNTTVTAGEEKKVELQIKNTGSAELKDITLNYNGPTNWDITFDPKKIEKLRPSETGQVFATIKADKKAIPGDYMVNLEARTPEVIAKAAYRVSVQTPLLWGWVGILIILIAVGSVYYLFRKYGRR